MINFNNVYNYCCDDITLIENYEAALNDKTQTWDCHHRLEIDLNLSATELKEKEIYYNVPAKDLIFLTHTEHVRIRRTGKPAPWNAYPKSEEEKRHISKKMKGKNNPMYGKPSTIRGKHRVYRDDGTFYMSF